MPEATLLLLLKQACRGQMWGSPLTSSTSCFDYVISNYFYLQDQQTPFYGQPLAVFPVISLQSAGPSVTSFQPLI